MNLNKFLLDISSLTLDEANQKIQQTCGIVGFFDDCSYMFPDYDNIRHETQKGEFGDWQTNMDLAISVCQLIKDNGIFPETLVEPTCGQGNFILAALTVFSESLTEIYGIEIYKPYIIQLKYKILEYFLNNPDRPKPLIHIFNENIFDFPLKKIKSKNNARTLILGNPPWVTNSKLGGLKSNNLPKKTNFKNARGLEAITGKGNFDIAEYITYQMFNNLGDSNATLAFLIKTSVAKNIIYEQRNGNHNLSNCCQFNIDAKREFNVSVSACLFMTGFKKEQSTGQCSVYDFYTKEKKASFGWVNDKFVSNVNDYLSYQEIDGQSQLTWRSGMKHDCSKVMELSYKDGILTNGFGENVDIENDLVFPLLKSSDIKDNHEIINRKFVIVTQHTTSDNTMPIAYKQPLTYEYLMSHAALLDNRGSSIYKNRPRFCIFGIGQYSFEPYKIAIAGLYKSTKFILVPPINGKAVMMDDTCYLLAFNDLNLASITLKILNSNPVQRFLKSTIFIDSKRCINKDLLMRINLQAAAKWCLNDGEITESEFQSYCKQICPAHAQNRQLSLFD